jgi:hypothetical protein
MFKGTIMKTPASGFNRLKKRLRDAIKRGDAAQIVQSVMLLGEHANEIEDYKMSARTFFEFADLLRQLRNDGQLSDGGQAQILELLRNGTDE